jgi:hypothetical protein
MKQSMRLLGELIRQRCTSYLEALEDTMKLTPARRPYD